MSLIKYIIKVLYNLESYVIFKKIHYHRIYHLPFYFILKMLENILSVNVYSTHLIPNLSSIITLIQYFH